MSERLRATGPWLLLGLLVAAILFGAARGGGGEGRAPQRSSISTGDEGFAAWAALLGESGFDIERRDSPPASGGFDPRGTVVALDTGELTDADADALAGFVAAGGRLILGGFIPAATIERVSGSRLALGSGDGVPAVALVPAPETHGVTAVSTTSGGALWTDAGPGLPLFGSPEGDLLVGLEPVRGAGEVALLADSSPLTNERLAAGDNALFAINLAAGRGRDEVEFLESLSIADGADDEGFGALPSSWILGFGGLLLAGLVLIASQLRRLGPPDGDPSAGAQPRIGYVDAMARILARSRAVGAGAEPVRRAALDRVAARSARPLEESADMLAAQAEQAGVPADEAAALAGPLDEPESAIKAARALARLWR